jgi:hypothetical protein
MAVNQAHILEELEQLSSRLNPDEFNFSFLEAFGFPKSTITRLRNDGDSRNVADPGTDDIALKKKLYIKQVEAGSDVPSAAEALKASDIVTNHDIRFVIVTDFKTLVAYDRRSDERLEIPFSELPQQYAFFLPLAGYEKAIMYSEHPADIKACEKMGQLFDLIREQHDSSNHALNVFLTRLLFCFYAEDTGIFEHGQMTCAIQSCTQSDGSDVDQFFSSLFTVLNLDSNSPQRKAMPTHFQAFPYVNGGLFKADEPIPKFGPKARRILIDCGSLNWSEINPDIFGSMFQAVIDEEQRGSLGQHYTSVTNIMKVIQPLFLDKLYAELEKSRGSKKKIQTLLQRLQSIRIFDPACGSGNFLIIAYKELRKFEMEVFKALNALTDQSVMFLSGIRLSQFYGIEIDDFAHEVALLSLWIAEHQMNQAFRAEFGYAKATLPLKDGGNVLCGNSLRLDWEQVCPKSNAEGNELEVYVCGNPPFLGHGNRSKDQLSDMKYTLSHVKTFKSLDFVACWFWKGANYISKSKAELALVATNSLCQGKQVSDMWLPIFDLGLYIHFAYQSFAWSNNAKDKAGVHVAIVGLSRESENKRLFAKAAGVWHGRLVNNITPYLTEGGNTVVTSRNTPLCLTHKMIFGNMPIDGGHLLLSRQEKDALLEREPSASRWIKRLYGAQEFINAKERYCLWLVGATEDDLNSMPFVMKRVNCVREQRLKSSDAGTRKLAAEPHLFRDRNNPENFILVPRVSSERRDYVPIGFFGASSISSDANQTIPLGTVYEFGILTSTDVSTLFRTKFQAALWSCSKASGAR